jgi:hypothetical protein
LHQLLVMHRPWNSSKSHLQQAIDLLYTAPWANTAGAELSP